MAVENSMRIPGALTVLGTPIALASADVPTHVLAGQTDHIVPWQNAYRATWWPDPLAWMTPRSGELKPKPKALGSKEHTPLADAPGTYVLAN